MGKQKRTGRRFTAEFKAETVKRVKPSDRTMKKKRERAYLATRAA
jgi:transposase-like protein